MRSALAHLVLLIVVWVPALASAETSPPGPAETLEIELPAQIDLMHLAEITGQFVGVSLQYNPQKITGMVKLSVRGAVTRAHLWDTFNQVLASQGFTTIVTDLPPIYQIVALTDAPSAAMDLTPAQMDGLLYKPGFNSVIYELAFISPEMAVKTLSPFFTAQNSLIRTLGPDSHRIVISATTPSIRAAEGVLALLDRKGLSADVRMFKPERANTQALVTAGVTAWTALSHISGQTRTVEIQIAPDGQRLVLIAAHDDMEPLQALILDLDHSEPADVRTYHPRYFSIDDVANLLSQIYRASHAGQSSDVDVVRDKLTNSLIVRASPLEHDHIKALIDRLDETPMGSRRQMRCFVVMNRNVDELAGVLAGLITSGSISGSLNSGAVHADVAPPAPTPPAPTQGITPPPPIPAGLGAAATLPATDAAAGATAQANPPTPATSTLATSPLGSADKPREGLSLTTDPATNRIIGFGDSRELDQIGAMIKQLDQRQPQVELDVTMATLSSSQNTNFGVEVIGAIHRGRISATVGSLFGLSSATDTPLDRTLGNPTGLAGIVLNPGDYTGVIQALETLNHGNALIRSHVVVQNNAKASVNGVVEQPISSINTGNTIATTSFGGTSDAGTQLSLSPTISAADYVTLTYQITQSAFIGSPTITAGGAAIPAPKSSNSVSSIATVPDGFVIALGGMVTTDTGKSATQIPLLGDIPFLGNLFKSQTWTGNESRFYVFIKVSIMRDQDFADLRRLSDTHQAESGQSILGWPHVEPRIIK